MTKLLKQGFEKRDWITCDYGAAIIMRVHEDGHPESMTFDGETMDAICKAWAEYRQQKQKASETDERAQN